MTKSELKRRLTAGAFLEELFSFTPGEECEIYKAGAFSTGEEIVYIPALWLNDLPRYRRAEPDEIPAILDCCYTGNDFISLTRNDFPLAERLFRHCSWQHPFSAMGEIRCVS